MTTTNTRPRDLPATLRQVAKSDPEAALLDWNMAGLLTDAAHAIELRDRVIDDLLAAFARTKTDLTAAMVNDSNTDGDVDSETIVMICMDLAEAIGRARGMMAVATQPMPRGPETETETEKE